MNAGTDRKPCSVPGCTNPGRMIGGKGWRCDLHRSPAVTVVCTEEPHGPAALAWVGEMYKNAVYALRKGVPLQVLRDELERAAAEFDHQPV